MLSVYRSSPITALFSGASLGSSACAGTPTSQERRRKRQSTFEDRLAAFQLGPETLRHMARSDEAHVQAMTHFLGEQVGGWVGGIPFWLMSRLLFCLCPRERQGGRPCISSWMEFFLISSEQTSIVKAPRSIDRSIDGWNSGIDEEVG